VVVVVPVGCGPPPTGGGPLDDEHATNAAKGGSSSSNRPAVFFAAGAPLETIIVGTATESVADPRRMRKPQ